MMHPRRFFSFSFCFIIGLLFTGGLVAADSSAPTLQYDNQRTGRTENIGPSQAELQWSFKTKGSIHGSPVIAPDGTLYIASTDRTLYALNSAGQEQWKYVAQESIFGTPALGSDGSVMFGDLNGRYYSVLPGGNEKWIFQLTGGNDRRILTSPVVDSTGQSYIGGWNDNFVAIRADGNIRWKSTVAGLVSSSPVLDASENVYIATQERSELAVRRFKPSSATSVWKYTDPIGVDYRIVASPAINTLRNAVYIGVCRDDDGILYGINTETGTRSFRKVLPKGILSSPAIAQDGTLYIGCLDGNLYAINPAGGTTLWSFKVDAPYIFGSPSIDGHGVIYIGDTDGILYAIAPDGKLLWKHELTSNIHSAPVVSADGTLYVTSYDSHLYAFTQPAAVRDWWLMNP